MNLAGGPGSFSLRSGLSNRGTSPDISHPSTPSSFSASAEVAQLLDGGVTGSLSQVLERRSDPSLQRAWHALNEVQRSSYERSFGSEGLETLFSLSEETNPALFYEGLQGLAERLENAERFESAGLLYQAIESSGISEALTARARSRWDAVVGRGGKLARAEFLGRRLLGQATDPAALTAMGLAGLVGRGVRLGMMSRLAVSPSRILSQGLVARGIAATTALAVEAPTFTAATRGMNAALGREQVWSGSALWREFAGGGITLLGLKVTGAIGGTLVQRFARGESVAARSAQVLIPQASLLAGIHLSHRAEVALELREKVDGATGAVDTFGTWLQFTAAGRFSRSAFGEGFHRAEQALDLRAEQLARQNNALPSFSGLFEALRGRMAGGTLSGRLARSAPLAASLTLCLTGCSVAGDGHGGVATIAAIVAGLGAMGMARSSEGGETAEPSALNPSFSHARAAQIQIGRSSLEMEARGSQAISDRLLASYEIALRNLLEGTEDGFGVLQGEVADHVRSDGALRQRILEDSGSTLSQRRLKAIIGPGGHLLGFEFNEAIGPRIPPVIRPAAPAVTAETSAPEIASSGSPTPATIPSEARLPESNPAVLVVDSSSQPPSVDEQGGPHQASETLPLGRRFRYRRTIDARFNSMDGRGRRGSVWGEIGARGKRVAEQLYVGSETVSPKRARFLDQLAFRLYQVLQARRSLTPPQDVSVILASFEAALVSGTANWEQLDIAITDFVRNEGTRSRQDGSLPNEPVATVLPETEPEPSNPSVAEAPLHGSAPSAPVVLPAEIPTVPAPQILPEIVPPVTTAPQDVVGDVAEVVALPESAGASEIPLPGVVEFYRYRNRNIYELRRLVAGAEAWSPVVREGNRLMNWLERNYSIGSTATVARTSAILYYVLRTRFQGATPGQVMGLLSLLDGAIAGTSSFDVVHEARASLEDRLRDSQTSLGTSRDADEARYSEVVESPGRIAFPEGSFSPSLSRLPAISRSWTAFHSRIEDLRDNITGPATQVREARRVLDTLERLEEHASMDLRGAEILLDLYEEETASQRSPSFERIHQARRAMIGQSSVLPRLQRLNDENASPLLVDEAYRSFHRLCFSENSTPETLSAAVRRLVEILDDGALNPEQRIEALEQVRVPDAIPSQAPVESVTESQVAPQLVIQPPTPTLAVEVSPAVEQNLESAPANPIATPLPLENSVRIASLEEVEAGFEGLSRSDRARHLVNYISSLYSDLDFSASNATVFRPLQSRNETIARLRQVRVVARRHNLWQVSATRIGGGGNFVLSTLVERLFSRTGNPLAGRVGTRVDPTPPAPVLQNPEISVAETSPQVERDLLTPPEGLPETEIPVAAMETVSDSAEEIPPQDGRVTSEPSNSNPSGVADPVPTPPVTLAPVQGSLAEILGMPDSAELGRIERFIHADQRRQLEEIPPTLARLVEIRRDLLQRTGLSPASEVRRDALVQRMEAVIQGPTTESIVAYLRRSFVLTASAEEIFGALSPTAYEGLYLLAVAIRQNNLPNLAVFLGRCSTTEEANQILETVALLHDRGVRGYENGFLPTRRDEKFLSIDSSRIHSLQAENVQALRLAGFSHVRRLWLAQRLPIDWSQLSSSDREFIEGQVIPTLGRVYRFDEQQNVEVDAGYLTVDGGSRILEVKTSRSSVMEPRGEQAAAIVLQAFRYALLVRQNNLEGVEYILEAPTVSPAFVQSLARVLDSAGVPYIIRVHETHLGTWRSLNNRMSAEEGSVVVSSDRLRPLPLPREEGISDTPPEIGSLEVASSNPLQPLPLPSVITSPTVIETAPQLDTAAEPWSELMVDFLNRDLSSSDRLSRRYSRDEALTRYSYLPEPVMLRVLGAINRFIREESEGLSAEVQARIAELNRELRTNPSGVKIGRTRAAVLFEIAALATGARELARPMAEARFSDSDAFNNFLRCEGLLENRLQEFENSLKGVEELLRESSPSELRPMLREYSPDTPLEITQDSQGRARWSLRNILNQLRGTGMQAYREVYGERLERVIALYESLQAEFLRLEAAVNP